jgi:hypothetical protein
VKSVIDRKTMQVVTAVAHESSSLARWGQKYEAIQSAVLVGAESTMMGSKASYQPRIEKEPRRHLKNSRVLLDTTLDCHFACSSCVEPRKFLKP